MFAIVRTGGKQYKVAEGDLVKVEKLDAAVGDKVSLEVLMAFDNGNISDGASKVEAEVVRQDKSKKIIVYKYKSKKNERKRQGHRQPYTQLKILSVQ